MNTIAKQAFIDKFVVPEKAIQEFKHRTNINMNLISKQAGFIKEEVYERFDEEGNLIFITIVVWENEEAIKKAKSEVQAEYKKQGFNPKEMMERLLITVDKATYSIVEN